MTDKQNYFTYTDNTSDDNDKIMENLHKQIIIDGVDVSNFCLVCYYDNKTNELVRIEQYNDNDSSMYSDIESYEYGYNAKIVKPEEIIKQLKAKEQECETLASQLDFEVQKKECLEQECERLKQLNCIYSIGAKQANELQETLDHKQAYINNVENYNEQLNEQLDQLKATLTEIKEIANSDNHYFSDGTILRYEVVNKILQKISEVVE